MKRRFIDIGANLSDGMYSGMYNGSQKHAEDLKSVIDRAFQNGGLKQIILTAGNYSESLKALEIAQTREGLYCTVGVHPTRCNELSENSEKYLENLGNVMSENRDKVVAFGEFGLDYERTQFCDIPTQKKYFQAQLDFHSEFSPKLPLFLHNRNSSSDLIEILSKYPSNTGVVHSFDGSSEDSRKILELGYYIGINGCSLKTEENLEVIKDIPSDRIMLETDCPWCEVRPTHAGFKYIKTKFDHLFKSVKKDKFKEGSTIKGRNEPMFITQILEIVSAVKEEDPDELSEKIYKNTEKMFFPKV